jgi:hypothetical protein
MDEKELECVRLPEEEDGGSGRGEEEKRSA